MVVFDIKCIELHRFLTIVQRFSSIFNKKHDSATFFIDFHRFWTTVQRFSSILGEGIRSSIFLKKTPSWKKYKKYAARAARAASAIGVHRIFRSNVFAWRFFDFLRDVRNGMIGFGSKIRHRGGTRKINGSGRGAGSAIGVHRICKSSVFAWRFLDFFGDVRNGMTVFEKRVIAWRFFDFFGDVRNGMKGILTNFGKFTKKKNPPDKPQVRYGRTEFTKVMFLLDVFFDFFGDVRNGMIGFRKTCYRLTFFRLF